uniref:F-box domain-containing protein n=1 Tax=Globodera rostochiensis TaxID=31243 RepID=A0A914GT50_GLORO
MSDNASELEQQQQMEEIFICDDIWLEVFVIRPFDVGLKMALISDRFDAFVDEHFKHFFPNIWNFYKMSDNESEAKQKQQMKEIFICDDIWYEVFAFLDPFDVGLKMALISDRLDVLVDVHFKSREWSLGSIRIYSAKLSKCSLSNWLRIRPAIGGDSAEMFNERFGGRLPIPQELLPDKVIGYKELKICYINQTVIEFLQRIRRLFDASETTVIITSFDDQSRSWEIIRQNILPLVSGNICSFLHLEYPDVDGLRWFSPAVLRNCANLRSIHSSQFFPEFPAEDNAEASSGQALAKWLLTPRGDGLPKMLYYGDPKAKIEGLKRAFVNALEPVNFIIRFCFGLFYVELFELTNNWTRERLSLRRINNKLELLVRCPIGREEDKWTKWEKEAIEWKEYRQWNCITIRCNDWDIGDGIIDANGSPVSPTSKWTEGI